MASINSTWRNSIWEYVQYFDPRSYLDPKYLEKVYQVLAHYLTRNAEKQICWIEMDEKKRGQYQKPDHPFMPPCNEVRGDGELEPMPIRVPHGLLDRNDLFLRTLFGRQLDDDMKKILSKDSTLVKSLIFSAHITCNPVCEMVQEEFLRSYQGEKPKHICYYLKGISLEEDQDGVLWMQCEYSGEVQRFQQKSVPFRVEMGYNVLNPKMTCKSLFMDSRTL